MSNNDSNANWLEKANQIVSDSKKKIEQRLNEKKRAIKDKIHERTELALINNTTLATVYENPNKRERRADYEPTKRYILPEIRQTVLQDALRQINFTQMELYRLGIQQQEEIMNKLRKKLNFQEKLEKGKDIRWKKQFGIDTYPSHKKRIEERAYELQVIRQKQQLRRIQNKLNRFNSIPKRNVQNNEIVNYYPPPPIQTMPMEDDMGYEEYHDVDEDLDDIMEPEFYTEYIKNDYEFQDPTMGIQYEEFRLEKLNYQYQILQARAANNKRKQRENDIETNDQKLQVLTPYEELDELIVPLGAEDLGDQQELADLQARLLNIQKPFPNNVTDEEIAQRLKEENEAQKNQPEGNVDNDNEKLPEDEFDSLDNEIIEMADNFVKESIPLPETDDDIMKELIDEIKQGARRKPDLQGGQICMEDSEYYKTLHHHHACTCKCCIKRKQTLRGTMCDPNTGQRIQEPQKNECLCPKCKRKKEADEAIKRILEEDTDPEDEDLKDVEKDLLHEHINKKEMLEAALAKYSARKQAGDIEKRVDFEFFPTPYGVTPGNLTPVQGQLSYQSDVLDPSAPNYVTGFYQRFKALPICNNNPGGANNPAAANPDIGCIQAVNLVQQGPGMSQRIGTKISLQKIQINMRLSQVNTEQIPVLQNQPTIFDTARLTLIYDRQPSGGIYPALSFRQQAITGVPPWTGSQLFGGLDPKGNIIPGNCYSYIDVNQQERFQIIWDLTVNLPTINQNAIAFGSTENESFVIDEEIPLHNLETIFGNNTSPQTINGINTGGLYLVSMGTLPIQFSQFQWAGVARLHFRDN